MYFFLFTFTHQGLFLISTTRGLRAPSFHPLGLSRALPPSHPLLSPPPPPRLLASLPPSEVQLSPRCCRSVCSAGAAAAARFVRPLSPTCAADAAAAEDAADAADGADLHGIISTRSHLVVHF